MQPDEIRGMMYKFQDLANLNSGALSFWKHALEVGPGFEGGTDLFKRLLIATLVFTTKAKLVYETGVNAGVVPLFLGPVLEELDAHLVGFEMERSREGVIQLVQDTYPGRIEIVWGDCLVEVPRRFRETGERPDFFHVDGPHGTDQAVQDIRNAVRVVRPGGIIMIDDATNPLLLGAINQIPCIRERLISLDYGSGTSIFQVRDGDATRLS